MTEDPWHLRFSTAIHEQWFKNLLELHELTQSWIKELSVDRIYSKIVKTISDEASQDLWMLDLLPQSKLDDLLDDTLPDDLLRRLEHTLWSIQSAVLVYFSTKLSFSEKS